MVLSLAVTPAEIVETGLVALALASVFGIGTWLRPFEALGLSDRTLVSLGAGVSVAYVFVHVFAEFGEASRVIAHLESIPTPFEGRMVYFVGLLGFLAAYRLDQVNQPNSTGSARERGSLIRHVGGLAVDVGLVGYLLVHGLDGESHKLFAVAMAANFLAINRTLRDNYGAAYTWPFHAVLAGAVLAGWAVGVSAIAPRPVVAMLLAFVSGAAITHSAVSALPAEGEGRLGPFSAGALAFGAIVLFLE